MISSRQEIDLRPQLERLDALMLRSAGLDPSALTFEFRPLWQLDAAEKATVALSKAQATAAYAGLNLWPADVTAQLVQAQLVEDGIYPNAETIFAEAREVGPVQPPPAVMAEGATRQPTLDFSPDQPRDPDGRWSGGGSASMPIVRVGHPGEDPNAGGDPNIEERLEQEEKEQTPPLEIGPRLIPKIRPDGTAEPLDPFGAVFGKPQVLPSQPDIAVAPAFPPGVGAGPYAGNAIAAGPSSRPNAQQRRAINAEGDANGCHTCGTMDPGTTNGNWIGDHQWPTAVNPEGAPQVYFPHCQACSDRQGGFVSSLKRKGYAP